MWTVECRVPHINKSWKYRKNCRRARKTPVKNTVLTCFAVTLAIMKTIGSLFEKAEDNLCACSAVCSKRICRNSLTIGVENSRIPAHYPAV